MPENVVSVDYIGTGCNKSVQTVDWGENNLIAFAACNSIAIYDPTAGKILFTLVGHKGNVNCVKWLQGKQNELISGASDSSVIVWTLEKQCDNYNRYFAVLNGHESSILAVDGRSEDLSRIVVSSASDNTVRIWRATNESKEFSCQKIIKTGSSFALCLSLTTIPNSSEILLCYGTDTPEIMLHSVGTNESDSNLLAKMTGHEDWIRSIDMKVLRNKDILIASSSQDMMIRISRLSTTTNDLSDGSFNLKQDKICFDRLLYYLSLESVLYGHEGWVYSVNWSPFEENECPLLLSASFDRTLIIWKYCPDTGLWLEESRMGELGGDNTLGYYGAKFSPDGLSILAHSYQGSFHLWKKTNSKWVTEYVIGGHCDAVTGISWERNGRYIISVSSDKSSRLHAPCLRGTSIKTSPWCELSRPQIHGHALYAVATLGNLGFASCSEEKVVRVFMPSINVLKLLNYFCDSIFISEEEACGSSLPSSASITALGLSNQADFQSNGVKSDLNTVSPNFDYQPPHEDFLAQHTLWPEVMKLYGHGNDVFTLAASNDNNILATASKATTAEQGKIILWDTKSWNIMTKLDGHQLTVTQMKFSPDDSYLLSVSRDRKWCLFKKEENGSYIFHSTSQKGKVMHSRIIWSCAWTNDCLYFATGSRDCKVIVWDKDSPVSNITSDNGSVTALDFGPVKIDDKYILAIGHESGNIQIYSWSKEWSLLHTVEPDFGHHLTVQRLQFSPVLGKAGEREIDHLNILQLASCSDDRSVRIFNINL